MVGLLKEKEEEFRLSQEHIDMIIDLYNSGHGYTAIAKRMAKLTGKSSRVGRSADTVKKVIRVYLDR